MTTTEYWADCIGDELIIGRLLIPQQWILSVSKLRRMGGLRLEREYVDGDAGSYVVCYTHPLDLVAAATVMAHAWGSDGILLAEECYHCGKLLTEDADVCISLESGEDICMKCSLKMAD